MLVYLATYPRSGNSLVQHILSNNFSILPLTAKKSVRAPNGPPAFDGFDVRMDRPPLASYNRLGKRYSLVPPQVANVFPMDVRRAAAESPDVMFVKTHALPDEHYLFGERILQVSRHPGAVLLSYFRYLGIRGQSASIEDVIEGNVPFGNWSDYDSAWRKAAAALGKRRVVLSYDRIQRKPVYAPTVISQFTGLIPLNYEPPKFEHYAAKRPELPLRGTTAGYEAYYTRDQLVLLWDRHGEAASQYGFEAPDLSAAGG